MIYTILRIAWWAVCLSFGLLTTSFYWSDSEPEPFGYKIEGSILIISTSILIAAVVQGLLTWIGMRF